jgi:hypothetical protein
VTFLGPHKLLLPGGLRKANEGFAVVGDLMTGSVTRFSVSASVWFFIPISCQCNAAVTILTNNEENFRI